MNALQKSRAPLLWLGNVSVVSRRVTSYCEGYKYPIFNLLVGNDLFSPIEGLYVGHAGTYGGRSKLNVPIL